MIPAACALRRNFCTLVISPSSVNRKRSFITCIWFYGEHTLRKLHFSVRGALISANLISKF